MATVVLDGAVDVKPEVGSEKQQENGPVTAKWIWAARLVKMPRSMSRMLP
ncbi:hypothetical protein AHiyo8_54290 [Arthrobacter sp. Hiyo8]|nr:hypothetical protein AHiyo8_54290 [Arthrobacter sp. Hiyo8]